MSTDVRQGDIYHARPIRVIGTTPGRMPIKLGQRPVESTHSDLDVRSSQEYGKKNDMIIPSDLTPPLPPRGVTSILSVKERFNSSKKLNENRYVKFSDFEQKRLLAESKRNLSEGGSGRVKSMVEKRENSLSTPPPKLPPRNRNATLSVKRDVTRVNVGKENGKVYPYDKTEIVNAFEKLSADMGTSPVTHQENVSPPTPEPQPLTRTNVTSHDSIWNSNDDDEKGDNGLSPPLKHITLQSTQEMLEKFDPLDVLDSASDHSESSADTMIMMTTEEEEHNREKISQSMQHYSSSVGKPFFDNVKLDVRLDNASNEVKSKQKLAEEAVNQLSPKSEDTDDGYGTNSSQGTAVSSPLSSSLNSLEISDFENSTNGNGNKGSRLTSVNNGTSAITTSGKTTWAVRRRAKMSEAREENNSVQEKLRELAIIEEEEHVHTDNARVREETKEAQRRGIVQRGVTSSNTDKNSLQQVLVEDEINGPVPTDLRKFEGDLFDKFTDMDRNYRNYYGFDDDTYGKDEKVLYFQQKMLKQNYSSDNYYNPRGYSKESRSERDFDSLLNLGQGSLPRAVGRDYSTLDSSSYRSNASSCVSSVDDRSGHVTNISYDQINTQGTFPGMPFKGQYNSVDNISANGRKPLFASSADIHKLFQSRNNIHDQLQRPANCRHSFHAMPCTQQWLIDASQNQADSSVPRQRAASTSAAMKSKSTWNPFGGMFSRKKNKSEQNKSNQTLRADESLDRRARGRSDQNVPPEVPARQPIIKSTEQSSQSKSHIGRTPSFRRYAEKSGIATLPNGGMQELPFRTVKVVEASGTKLSTLV